MGADLQTPNRRRVAVALGAPVALLGLYQALHLLRLRDRLAAWSPSLDPTVEHAIDLAGPLLIAGLALALVERRRDWLAAVGFARPLLGLGIGCLCLAPMAIGMALAHGRPHLLPLFDALENGPLPGLVEELIFRGIAYRQLRAAGWSFWPAALATSALFGAGHWHYGSETVVLLTAVGGLWYAWLLERWNNLMLVITLHGLMDLLWAVFSTDAVTNGNLDAWVNITRVATVALSVVLTRRLLPRLRSVA